MNIQPKNGYIVMKPTDTSEEMIGNIILPDMGKERPETGEVIATSGTYNYHSDKVIPSSLNVVDIVMIPKMRTTKHSIGGADYTITK